MLGKRSWDRIPWCANFFNGRHLLSRFCHPGQKPRGFCPGSLVPVPKPGQKGGWQPGQQAICVVVSGIKYMMLLLFFFELRSFAVAVEVISITEAWAQPPRVSDRVHRFWNRARTASEFRLIGGTRKRKDAASGEQSSSGIATSSE